MTASTTDCQVCGHAPLEHVISLGYMPSVNWMEPVGSEARTQAWLPTELLRCPRCELIQLGYVAHNNDVFPPHYPYTSGSTRLLRDNFEDLAEQSIGTLGLKPGDLVIDIGSNDGTLLSSFKRRGMRVLGIEPTDVADVANGNDIPTEKVFFTEQSAAKIASFHGKAHLVTCCNCFAHMPDPNGIMRGIDDILRPGGSFVSESHYVVGLLARTQYDTIYHEHLRYYSVASLLYLLNSHGMKIDDVKPITTHGGSIRVYASTGQANVGGVGFYMDERDKVEQLLKTFRWDVLRARRDLMSTVHRLRVQGRVVGIGAPSRASVVVSYCGLDEELIDYVCELPGSMKIGRYMPGTRIPVVDEARLFADQPEAAVVFSWHLFDEIEKSLRAKGYRGELVRPI